MRKRAAGRVPHGGASLAFVAALTVATPTTACRAQAPVSEAHRQATTLRTHAATTLGFDRFGARLLASVIDEGAREENVVLSPVSAGFALSLASLGARGGTAEALARVLDLPSLDRQAVVQRGARTAALLSRRTDVQLEIANAIWVDSTVRLSPSVAASAAAWKGAAGTLRLSSTVAMSTINQWVDRATHGRISGILDEPLAPSTRLVLANALYFKGRWADAFEASATRPRDFTIAPGRRIRTPAMERVGRVGYGRAKGFQVVRLPYEGGRAAMYVLLPDSGMALRTLMQQFAAKGWPTALGGGAERDVHVVLPKLHVERSLNLRPPLEKLGGGVAFDCRRADFRDLAVTASGGTPMALCIDRATQKVYMDVSEQGTEAAAATGISTADSAAPPPPLDFIVDRPFLFVLRDESSGSDLFVGVIKRPQG